MKLKVDFENENIENLIFKLAYPSVIAMLVNALYNIIDGIFLGQFVGIKALGATNAVFPLISFFMALSVMSGVGLSSIVSRTLGKKRQKFASTYIGIAIIGAIFLGLIIVLLGFIFGDFLLKISGAAPEIFKESQHYFYTLLFGWIVFPLVVLFNNLLRSIGQAKKASFLMIFGILINIILVPIFILIFKLGIIGAGLATSISQIMSIFLILYYIKKNIFSFKFKKKYFKFNIKILLRIYSYGLSSFLRQFINSFTFLIYNQFFLMYGGINYLNAMGIIIKLYAFITMPICGLLQGIQPVIGYNYGSKNLKRIKESTYKGACLCFFISLCSMLLIFFLKEQILSIFTNNIKVLSIAKEGIMYIFVCLPLISFQMIGTASYQAFGKVSVALLIALIRQLIFGIPILLIMAKILGMLGVWLSFPISDICSAFISIIIIEIGFKKIKKNWEK